MKVIYIFFVRHCYTSDNEKFQFYAFRDKGWNLEVWSTVNWVCPCPEPDRIEKESFVHYINSKRDLLDNFDRIKGEACYFLLYPYFPHAEGFLTEKILKKLGYNYSVIFMSQCMYPSSHRIKLTYSYVYCLHRLFYLFFSKFFHVLIGVILKRNELKQRFSSLGNFFLSVIYSIKYKADYNFVPTSLSFFEFLNPFEVKSKRNILIHANSYDEYLGVKQNVNISNNYVVFIDDYMPGHSDFVKMKWNFPVSDSTDYYNKINKLFLKIENDLNCEIIIAAHPKAEYSGGEFNGRKIYFDKTPELVKNCVFSITEGPTTVFGLICLFKKPFLNILDEIWFENLPVLRNDFFEIPQEFGKMQKSLDISDVSQINRYNDYLFYDEKVYEKYLNRYVVQNSSIYGGKLFYEVVESFVSRKMECLNIQS